MIRDKIVFSTSGKMQQLLLREDELDLRKAIKICQSYEQVNKHIQEMKGDGDKVHKIKTKKHHATSKPDSKQKKKNTEAQKLKNANSSFVGRNTL